MARRAGLLAVLGAALAAATASGAPQATVSFQLVLNGVHKPATFDTPSGTQHEGAFTTSADFCPSGSMVEFRIESPTTALRRFTCDGGAGEFVARVIRYQAEHGGTGAWQIVGASGALATLRGRGTFVSELVPGGDPVEAPFHSTWQGVVAFDAAPPLIAASVSAVRRLDRPAGAYRLDLSLAIRDESSARVGYLLTVVDVRRPFADLVTKIGRATASKGRLSLRVHPAKGALRLRVKFQATDPVGNVSTKTLSVRLR